MKFDFSLTYDEVSTIHDALVKYLDYWMKWYESAGYDSKEVHKMVAYSLYFKFRKIVDEVNES